jgi:molybdate transport system substrate-binding protein
MTRTRTPSPRTTTRLLGTVTAAVALTVTAACSDRATSTAPAATPSSAAGTALEGPITVFAAASLTDAFTEIGATFEAANPGTTVTFAFAGSSALVQQIVEGAPADVFASADLATMAKLADAGQQAGVATTFATNRLAIAVEPDNPRGVASLADLADADLAVVLCAEQVPCGRLAVEVLDRAGVDVRPRSLEESVRSVLQKVELGEADAGIVYATDIAAAGSAVTGVAIPDGQNVVAQLPVAVTTGARNPDVARAFVAFVAGPEGRGVLERFGFGAP